MYEILSCNFLLSLIQLRFRASRTRGFLVDFAGTNRDSQPKRLTLFYRPAATPGLHTHCLTRAAPPVVPPRSSPAPARLPSCRRAPHRSEPPTDRARAHGRFPAAPASTGWPVRQKAPQAPDLPACRACFVPGAAAAPTGLTTFRRPGCGSTHSPCSMSDGRQAHASLSAVMSTADPSAGGSGIRASRLRSSAMTASP